MPTCNVMCTCDVIDYDFCVKNGLKFSQLLRWAISERKQILDGSQTFTEENRKRKAFQDLSAQLREFVEKKGLLDDWLKEKNVVV